MHRARAAGRNSTAKFGSLQTDIIAKDPDKRYIRLRVHGIGFLIDGDVVFPHYYLCRWFNQSAVRNTTASRDPTISFAALYDEYVNPILVQLLLVDLSVGGGGHRSKF